MTDGISLVRYDAMCRAIDQAHTVDDVKDIRDKALAIEAYTRQAKNKEAERRAREIRLRAERKVGKLLRQSDKAKGTQLSGRVPGGAFRRSHDETAEAKSLADLGISKGQSSRWQQLADIPDEQFETALTSSEKPSTTGIIKTAKPVRPQAADDRAHWLWVQLRDFEILKVLDADPRELFDGMPARMRVDTRRLARLVCDWLNRLITEVERLDALSCANATTPACSIVSEDSPAGTVETKGSQPSGGENDRVTSPDSVNPQNTIAARTPQPEMPIPNFLDRRGNASR